MPRYIGFDAHKSYAYVAELREDGKRIDYRVALPNGLPGFKQRLDSDCQLVLEASTNTFRLVDELKPHVGKIVVTDPAQTRGAISRPATTDRNAAEALARLLASDFVRPVWVPPQEIRSLRSLVELRVRLKADLTLADSKARHHQALVANLALLRELALRKESTSAFPEQLRAYLRPPGAQADLLLRMRTRAPAPR